MVKLKSDRNIIDAEMANMEEPAVLAENQNADLAENEEEAEIMPILEQIEEMEEFDDELEPYDDLPLDREILQLGQFDRINNTQTSKMSRLFCSQFFQSLSFIFFILIYFFIIFYRLLFYHSFINFR